MVSVSVCMCRWFYYDLTWFQFPYVCVVGFIMMWFQFLSERLEVAKYSSKEQVEVFVSLLQKSLTASAGRPHNIMSRQVTAVGTRFR